MRLLFEFSARFFIFRAFRELGYDKLNYTSLPSIYLFDYKNSIQTRDYLDQRRLQKLPKLLRVMIYLPTKSNSDPNKSTMGDVVTSLTVVILIVALLYAVFFILLPNPGADSSNQMNVLPLVSLLESLQITYDVLQFFTHETDLSLTLTSST